MKQCAALKKQFLPYFTEGTFIGDCLLTEPCPGTHAAAYVLHGRLLLVLINENVPRKISFQGNLGLWFGSDAKTWRVKTYNESGKRVAETKLSRPSWSGQTPLLRSGEMVLLEVESQGR